MDSASIREVRKRLINNPVHNVPAWTVALLDPTKGNLPRRQVDAEGTIRYSEAIAREGAAGVLYAASTGWGHVRTKEEHRRTLEIGGQAALNETVKQALLRIEDPIDFNRRLIHDTAVWGYGIVWTRRGTHLPKNASDRDVAGALFPFARAAVDHEMPFGVYSISTVDGAPLRASSAALLIKQLGKEASKFLVAIKITESDFETSTQQYLDHPSMEGKKIVQGWDAFYTRALQAGSRPDGTNRCGATSGAAACMVKAFHAMHVAALKKDWDTVKNIQKVVSAVFMSMQGPDKSKFPDLQIAKRVMGLGHPLIEDRTLDEVEKLVCTVENLASHPETQKAAVLVAKSLLIMGDEGLYRSPFYDRLKIIETPEIT